MHIFEHFLDLWGVMVAYDYDCAGGVFFVGHSCPMDSFYGGFMVRWVRYYDTHSF